METGCPHELRVEATADWPDDAEITVHVFLSAHSERREWFRDSDKARMLIAWMQELDGLDKLKAAFAKARKPLWTHLVPKAPRRLKPRISMEDKVDERFERIKQRYLTKQSTKRSKEAVSQPAG